MDKNSAMIDIDKIIEEVTKQHPYKKRGNWDSYNPYNEGWGDACDILGEKIKQALSLHNVSQQRELLVKFLNEIDYKELDKCNYLPNIPKVVDDYLTNCG